MRTAVRAARIIRREYWGKGKLQQTNEEQPGAAPDIPVGIVGGSAAGLFAALLLARAGRSVRLFERTERLDPNLRTLIVTNRIRDLLGSSLERSVVNEIRRFELFTDGRAATIELGSPDLIIERSLLIRALADEAQSHGTQLEFGRRFASLEAKGAGIEMSLAQTGPRKNGAGYERVSCSAVVGAVGAGDCKTAIGDALRYRPGMVCSR